MTKYILAAFMVAFSFCASAKSTCPGKFLNDNPPAVKYDQEICFTDYAVLYSYQLKDPVLSAEYLTADEVKTAGQMKRKDSFHAEPKVPAQYQSKPSDYHNSGYDQGHMACNGDAPDVNAQFDTFSLANMTPQLPDLNRKAWRLLEESVRKQVLAEGSAYIITGMIPGTKTIGHGVNVPSFIWKAVKAKSGEAVYLGDNTTGKVTKLTSQQFEQAYHINPFGD
ncbi:DNA/RNA non-specific endonuclease [Pantoea stewartii]|uniref:DNA/RNA non-specific endonuclease n=1 Tax=Pantoea stewartii TaxID=66269 RepID=UPI00124569AF|nr:DNA/RNA non-specific endonuclease [Pantoea stewartii]KAB0556218.1 DNA/RNA non-specific endonuclease [Pantoea stewartii subsp. stewartii]